MAKTQKTKRQLKREEPVPRDIENAIAYAEAAEPQYESIANGSERPATEESKPSKRKEVKSTASARRQRDKQRKGLAMQDKLEARVERAAEKQSKRQNAKRLWA